MGRPSCGMHRVPFGYAISTSLPAESLDANLDLDWVLPLVSELASLLLSIITTAAIPCWCRKVSHQAYGAAGNPLLTSRLMQLARLWISILAPALAVALIHEGCLGRWDRCGEDADYFDLSLRELSGYALHMKTNISNFALWHPLQVRPLLACGHRESRTPSRLQARVLILSPAG